MSLNQLIPDASCAGPRDLLSLLRDPDGGRTILHYAGDNRLNPPWRPQDA